jgi:Protein of unknown function DUF262
VSDIDRSIDGVAKTVAEVLEKKKYSIDYYQREYKWESKQLKELVADLTTKFFDLYEPGHARKDVAKYPGYFLGSIIISQKGRRGASRSWSMATLGHPQASRRSCHFIGDTGKANGSLPYNMSVASSGH